MPKTERTLCFQTRGTTRRRRVQRSLVTVLVTILCYVYYSSSVSWKSQIRSTTAPNRNEITCDEVNNCYAKTWWRKIIGDHWRDHYRLKDVPVNGVQPHTADTTTVSRRSTDAAVQVIVASVGRDRFSSDVKIGRPFRIVCALLDGPRVVSERLSHGCRKTAKSVPYCLLCYYDERGRGKFTNRFRRSDVCVHARPDDYRTGPVRHQRFRADKG